MLQFSNYDIWNQYQSKEFAQYIDFINSYQIVKNRSIRYNRHFSAFINCFAASKSDSYSSTLNS